MLQNGAKLVYAVDVGPIISLKYAKIHVLSAWSNLTFVMLKNDFEEGFSSFASIDVSFISFESHFTGST